MDPKEPLAAHLRAQRRRPHAARDPRPVRGVLHVPPQRGRARDAGRRAARGVNDIELRVNFVIGLREDALPQLDRFKGRIPDLFGNYLRLDYLDREAGREAIVEPARHFNETVRRGRRPSRSSPRSSRTCSTGPGRAADALRQPGARGAPRRRRATRIETPYLQLVMEELWRAGTAGGGAALHPRDARRPRRRVGDRLQPPRRGHEPALAGRPGAWPPTSSASS